MRWVNIYIETDSTVLKEAIRRTGYVMECLVHGEAVTRETFGTKTGTYNAAVLQTMAEALGRMKEPCEIHIYSRNVYVMNMLQYLPEWEQEGYRLKSGELRKNTSEWQAIRRLSTQHLLVGEAGEHPYSEWMIAQMAHLVSEHETDGSDNKNGTSDNKTGGFDNK
ncbi:MAG: hypothetical protein LUI87_02155 [Lachnospiraceae bacterium]|nr:hypothetical protein [Lachnospiraceae bacterium]